jgi:hypothetical protein
MATIYKVLQNQSMKDVVLQATGSMEAGMQFCLDNGLSITDAPEPGTVYVVSDAALALGDATMLRYYRDNNIIAANANLGACGMVTGVALEDVGTTYAAVSFSYGDTDNVLGVEWVWNTSHDVSGDDVVHFQALIDYEGFADTDGLMAGTKYYFHIRSRCRNHSGWQVVGFITPAVVVLFEGGRIDGDVGTYAVTAFTMTDTDAAVTVSFPFSSTLSVLADDADEAALLAYIAGIGSGAGMAGTFSITGAGAFVYANAPGENFGDVGDATVMCSWAEPHYDATLGGNVMLKFHLSMMIVDWGDGSGYVYVEDPMDTGISLPHTYGAMVEVKARYFHNESVKTWNFSDQYASVPRATLLRFGGHTKFPSKYLGQLSIQINNGTDATLSIPVDTCAAGVVWLFISANAQLKGFGPSLFTVPMPHLVWVDLSHNILTSVAVDAAVNDFVANSWDGVSAVTWSADLNAGAYTSASLAARNAIVAAGGTVA